MGNNWRFTTLTTPPNVVSYDPVQDETGVVVDKILTLTFDRAISEGVGGNINIIRTSGSLTLGEYWVSSDFTSDEITLNGNQLFIDPIPDFEDGFEYYVTIDNNAIEGFVGIDNSAGNNWRFTVGTPPVVITSYDPVKDEVNVAVDKTLTLTFNQVITAGAGGRLQIVKSSDFSVLGDYLISTGSISPEITLTGNQLIIDPVANFDEGELYYVTIENGAIENFSGIDNSLGNNWRFTTLTPPPVVTDYDPIQDAIDVANDKVLTLTFNQLISKGAGGNIQVIRTSDSFVFGEYWVSPDFTSDEITLSGNQLFIDPIPDFTPGTEYYVIIQNSAITGFEGIDNSELNNWRFTTLIPPPLVLIYNPLHNATDVNLSEAIELTFDTNIQFSNGAHVVRIRRNSDDSIFQEYLLDGGVIDPDLSISGALFTINHLPFEYNTQYYVTISSGAIESLAGGLFAGLSLPTEWSFTTQLQPLSVTLFNPDNGANDVPLNQVLSVTFNQDIRFSSTLNTIRIRRVSDDSIFQTYNVEGLATDANLSITDATLSIQHTLFEGTTDYYVTIDEGAIESTTGISFPGFSSPTVWSFTTQVPPDPPYVIIDGLNPAPGAIGVAINHDLVATFNEDMERGTGVMTIYRGDATEFTSLPASSTNINISGPVITITHPDFEYVTDYYVIIPAGFFRSVAGADFPGLTLSTDWFFQTEYALPVWTVDPFTSDQNASTLTLNGEVDQTGNYYFIISSSAAVPTNDQIETGLDALGIPAIISGNGPCSANLLFSHSGIDITALVLGYDYYLHIVAKSGPVFSERRLLVIDRFPPTILATSVPVDQAENVDIGIQIVLDYNEKLYRLGQEITNANINSLGIVNLSNGGIVPITSSISADGQSITVIPDSPLLENTTYTIEILSLEDEFENIQQGNTYRTFTTDKQNRWTGGGDPGNWADPLNWQDGNYVSERSVVILSSATSYPVISGGTYDIFNLTVEAGALLTLSGGTINVTGEFRLMSSTTVNASFINTGGFINVNPIQVRIDQVVSNPSVTYFFSSPVSGPTPSSIGTTGLVYQFNNSTGLYSVVVGSGVFETGRGYATRSTQPLVFRGAINNGNISYPVFRSAAGFGWNLVGNPYPASIDWTLLNNTNLEDAFWIWNQDFGNYGVYNSGIVTNHLSGPVIPSNQGFIVKVLLGQTGGTVGFNTGALTQNTETFLKSSTRAIPHIKFAGVKGSLKDEMAIALTPNASSGIDKIDTEKFFSSTAGLFELYSQVGTMSTVISSYPDNDFVEIPLGFNAKTTGSFGIELVKNKLPGYKVIILDMQQSVQLDVTNGGIYNFTVNNTGRNITRFKVQFIKQVPTTEFGTDEAKVTIFVNNATLFISLDSGKGLCNYELLDLNGRILKRGLLLDSEVNKVEGLEPGPYIIKIINKNQSVSNHKVVVY